MRCSQCGLPLSPSRTHCPRCGVAISGGEKRSNTSSQLDAPFAQPGMYPPNQQAPMGAPQAWGGAPVQQQNWPPQQGAQPVQQQNWPPQQGNYPGQQPFVAQQGPYQGAPGYPGPYPQQPLPFVSVPQSSRGQQKKMPRGFLIAGACVVLGGILLFVIYFLAQGLSSHSDVAQGPTNSSTTPAAQTQPTTAPATPTPAKTAIATPTASTNLPGKDYIVTAQMASAVDEKTGKISQPETTFKVNEQVFVAWQADPHGKAGAVCLQWTFNGQHDKDTDVQVAMKASYPYSYSYFYPGIAGPASVELYWASTTDCTDQVLAQKLDFTVSE